MDIKRNRNALITWCFKDLSFIGWNGMLSMHILFQISILF